jgi:DNA-directed RNA polymerase subunit N (RpoN/RPB10)
VEFSLAHRIPVACFSCHKINKISISWLNYSRKQEILLKNLLQNQQNLNASGIYSCTGIYFFKSVEIIKNKILFCLSNESYDCPLT